jgi:predicted amidohydrolase YtcJ
MLCSEDGNQIYTVEEESPTVACLGVRAGEILATGERSTSNASP